MDHGDHVNLLRPALVGASEGAVWADIGAGRGAFTLALADLLGPGAHVIAIDRDVRALEENRRAVASAFPATILDMMTADFSAPLELPPLDGLVAANSLHYVRRTEQSAVVAALTARLKPGGTFVVVEYDADNGNHWVPYPFSARAWPQLANGAGLTNARVVGRVPSRFLGAIYSASAQRPPD